MTGNAPVADSMPAADKLTCLVWEFPARQMLCTLEEAVDSTHMRNRRLISPFIAFGV